MTRHMSSWSMGKPRKPELTVRMSLGECTRWTGSTTVVTFPKVMFRPGWEKAGNLGRPALRFKGLRVSTMGNRITYVALRVAIAWAAAGQAAGPTWTPQTSGVSARLRGVSAVDARVVWASGANGT